MTSNIGSDLLLEGLDENHQIKKTVSEAVFERMRKQFKPEFLNRIDDTILFKPLLKEELIKIIDLQIEQVNRRIKAHDIYVEFTKEAKHHILEEAYHPHYGARPIKRFIQSQVETLLGRAIISGEVQAHQKITLDVDKGSFIILK